jgi:hypothetical protein
VHLVRVGKEKDKGGGGGEERGASQSQFRERERRGRTLSLERERAGAGAEGYRSTVKHDNAARFERFICELFDFEKVGHCVIVFLILQCVDVAVVELGL